MMLIRKFPTDLCMVCWILQISFNSSFIDSMMNLLRSKILSHWLRLTFFIFFLGLAISCIPLPKSRSDSFLEMYPLSANPLPNMSFVIDSMTFRSRSSTFHFVRKKDSISPRSLMIRCSLNPKNKPMEQKPLSATFLKVLC